MVAPLDFKCTDLDISQDQESDQIVIRMLISLIYILVCIVLIMTKWTGFIVLSTLGM